MITLYILPEAFGLRNVSPFCLKLEMVLKYLGLDYKIAFEGDPRKAPKQKMPFIELDDERIGDSELIYDLLDQKTHGGLFGNLSPVEKAQGTAFTRLVEDHLYWIMVASRWLDDDWFPNVKRDFFGLLPFPVRGFVSNMARKSVLQTYKLHGLGKHTLEEQKQLARRDFQAINDVVAESSYIVGGRLTVFDFTVASLVAGILDQKPVTWINEVVDEFPGLRAYAERVQEEVNIFGRVLAA